MLKGQEIGHKADLLRRYACYITMLCYVTLQYGTRKTVNMGRMTSSTEIWYEYVNAKVMKIDDENCNSCKLSSRTC